MQSPSRLNGYSIAMHHSYLLICDRNVCNLRRLITFREHRNANCLDKLKTQACTRLPPKVSHTIRRKFALFAQAAYYPQITVGCRKAPDKVPFYNNITSVRHCSFCVALGHRFSASEFVIHLVACSIGAITTL